MKKISMRVISAILMIVVLAMSLPLSAFAASVDLPFIIYVEIDEPMLGDHPILRLKSDVIMIPHPLLQLIG